MNYHQEKAKSDPEYWKKYNQKYHPRYCKICKKQLTAEKYSHYHKGCVIDEIYDTIYSGNVIDARLYALAKRYSISVPKIRKEVIWDSNGIKPVKENRKVELSIDEIKSRYHEAKNKAEQIQILADMNLCEKWEIIKALVEAGVSPKCFGRHQSLDYQKALQNGMKVPDFEIAENGYKSSAEGDTIKDEKLESYEKTIEAYKAEIENLKQKTQEWDDMYSELETKYADVQKQNSELLEQIEELENEYGAVIAQTKSPEEVAKLQQSYQNLERFIIQNIASGNFR